MKNLKTVTFILGSVTGFLLTYLVNDWEMFKNPTIALFSGCLAALTSFFLDFAFREGNIFAFWMKFLNKYFYNQLKNPFRFLYSPLGGCMFCMNIWVASTYYVIAALIFGIAWWYILPSALVAHLILNYLAKHFNLD